jgi:hypothetical protein
MRFMTTLPWMTFVDELLELRIVLEVSEGEEVLLTSPLFTVPKEGQEGQ